MSHKTLILGTYPSQHASRKTEVLRNFIPSKSRITFSLFKPPVKIVDPDIFFLDEVCDLSPEQIEILMKKRTR